MNVNWEAASFGLTCVVIVFQGITMYVVLTIKLWTTEKFVSYDRCAEIRELSQKAQSYERVRQP